MLFSELYVFLFILLLNISQFNIKAEDDSCVKNGFQKLRSDIFDALKKFGQQVKTLIFSPFKKMERKRQKIKKALHKFIDDSFKDDKFTELRNGISDGDVDSTMLMPELVSYHGYRPETHTLITTDGYMLTVHRILPGFNTTTRLENRIVLFHHGLLGSSADWILLGANRALPYLLSDIGYDVWLTNARGNSYSNTHITKPMHSPDFWNFSWHEVGIFDLSAVIDYIREVTESNSSLHFIGHSMGATVLLVLLSISPQYNQVLKSATLLAPLVFMYQTKGPLRFLADIYASNQYDQGYNPAETKFKLSDSLSVQDINKFCKGDQNLCMNSLLFLTNGGQAIANERLMAKILGHVPAGGSTKTIVHYCQLIKSGQFQMFDYGPTTNLKRYGNKSPPTYRLNDVTLPITVFSSVDDWLSNPSDIQSLLPNLPNLVIHHMTKKSGFSHTDFVLSENTTELYNIILNFFEYMKKNKDLNLEQFQNSMTDIKKN